MSIIPSFSTPTFLPKSPSFHFQFSSSTTIPTPKPRVIMCAHHNYPDHPIVVGCGGVSMDYLLMVDGFPMPDQKIQGTSSKVQGGGNVGNALTCAARLGLRPKLIAKVAEDTEGRAILEELEADGVDTSFVVVSKEGRSMYSYVIVDSIMKSRTAIYYPGYPPFLPSDFSSASLSSALDGARLVYFDGLSLTTALVVAEEACRRNTPILVDAEMGEEGFEKLLNMADYAVCSSKYPHAWTKAPSMSTALVSMLLKLPKLKFVIVTLGEEGCIMLERSINGNESLLKEMNVDQCLMSLNHKKDSNATNPTCVSSPVLKLEAPGIGILSGRLLVGTAERIPPLELVDTTGAGDAFIGAVLCALCTGMPPEKMLPFAAQVAAGCCRDFGARSGLPYHTDKHLQPFLDQYCDSTPTK